MPQLHLECLLLFAALILTAVPPGEAFRRSRPGLYKPHGLQEPKMPEQARGSMCDHFGRALDEYVSSPSLNLWNQMEDAVAHGLHPAEATAHEKTAQWMRQRCDPALWRRFIEVAPYPDCGAPRPLPWQTPACAGLRTCAQRHTTATNASNTPHIAVLLSSTAKNVATPSVVNMALFTISLPSLAKTVECGFRYTVFLGYDDGDTFFDTPAGLETLRSWFHDNVRAPLHKGGIDIDLTPVRVDNPGSKPGPAFNAVARRAQSAAADFFYRINDDTLLLTPWAGAFACTLCSLGPPYGVVGPVESVRGDILTHDFVHAMHLDIFREYYPAFLTDWWLDDWISKVYGAARSYRLAEVKVGQRGERNKNACVPLQHIERACASLGRCQACLPRPSSL